MEDGWVEYVDPASGHPYLYHAESGESRWVVAKPPEAPAGSPNGHAVNGAPHEEAEAAAYDAPFAWPFGLPAGGSGGLATTQRLSPLSAWYR